MNGLTIALGSVVLAASAATFSAPPSASEEIQACKNTCTSIEDETDRATCRLNCTQAGEGKDRASMTRWTEERSVGGPAPGQQTAPPPVRTVTTVTPRGTTTTTNAPATKPSPKPAPSVRTKATVASPRAKYYFGLVDCQDRCNGQTADLGRAQCKLQCLRRRPGPPPPREAAQAPDPAPAGPIVAPALGQPKRPTPQPDAKTGKSDPATAQACRNTCSQQQASCDTGCSGSGSDASTCRLQCEQVGRHCSADCSG